MALMRIFAVGVAVTATLVVIGVLHDGPRELPLWWFTSVQSMKAWVATIALGLVVAQVVTATWMYGRLPGVGGTPRRLAAVHRLTGLLAFLITLPVAFYCLFTFGFDTATPRTFAHSLLGCAFYGAFASKMLALRIAGVPGWLVPVLGGTVFVVFALTWTVSAAWWFQLVGFGR